MSDNNKVLLALSGGVDSAACVHLLQAQGYDVEGLVIHFSPAHDDTVAAAQIAAQELGIPLAVAHCDKLFESAVIAPFCSDYLAGRTPNPCVVCNPLVKFKVLADYADEKGISLIATGHYARIVIQEDIPYIAKASSVVRDQSYMLYRLPLAVRQRLLLPAGEKEKDAIRDMAKSQGLSSAEAADSQEICFIPDGDYAAYILARGGHTFGGDFIAPDGDVLGPHKGVLHYTVGQRRGLGVALGQPVFVQEIQPNGNIQLAYANDLYARGLTLTDVVTSAGHPLANGCYDIKIRSMAKAAPCRCTAIEDGRLEIVFDTPQRAPAPGQHGVLYTGELVAGGGVIDIIIH